MDNIAVIPARSGSKGLKDKNIKSLRGKPLLAYSIEAAVRSGRFRTVHVSTDSEYYAEIARRFGADVPFLRREELASDTTSMWDAMRFVVQEYAKTGKSFDTLTVLQPTSPLRTEDDIRDAFTYFEAKDAKMISSVCEMEHSPLWSNVLPVDMSMKDFEDERLAFLPRQQLPVYYRENGAIYILKVEHLFRAANIYKEGCYAYVMDKMHSVDIDTEYDFLIAEAVLNRITEDIALSEKDR